MLSTPVEGAVELLRESMLRVAVSDCFLECLKSRRESHGLEEAAAKSVMSRGEPIPQKREL